MGDNSGELQVYNPDKQISEQITLKTIVQHDVAMKLTRTGLPEIPLEKPLTFNERITLRFKGLNLVISSQQCLVTNARPIVKVRSEQDWRKKNKTEEEEKENPFNDDDNDYNELKAILYFLDKCEQKIITARKTKKLSDDFVLEKEDHEGNIVLELSSNFFELMKELEESYEVIYEIMLKNKIVSSGITIDEEITEKQKEDEVLRRIVES